MHLHNDNVGDGITLHWHGVDVPNAEDGVAGVTQNAVMPGHDYTYRFVAQETGTFWYHSHQVSHEQVIRGLLGPLVVLPRHVESVRDVVAVSHTYDGIASLNGLKQVPVKAQPGQRVRLRLINTDNGPTQVWASAPYRVVAIDGHDVNKPTDVTGKGAILTAGGRLDLRVVAPKDAADVRVQVGAATAVLVGDGNARVKSPPPPRKHRLPVLRLAGPDRLRPREGRPTLRVLHRATPRLRRRQARPVVDDQRSHVAARADVRRERGRHREGAHLQPQRRRPPDAPARAPRRRAVPQRSEGHRQPVVVDSLNVENKETYEVAFVANNPGVWMDHCHNLQHAAQGLVSHLMYAGVTDPYMVGGHDHNEPE